MSTLLLLLAAPALLSQEPAREPGRIVGRALSSITDEPIRKATIHLQSPVLGSKGITTSTGDDGEYHFDNLAPGRYRLSGEKQGFVRTSYGSRRPFSLGGAIDIQAGETARNIVIKIIPAAVVSGRVVDEEAQSIENAWVTILRPMNAKGDGSWMRIGNAVRTNDRGEFRITNLAPGPIRLAVQDSRFGPAFAYPRVYFPGVDTMAHAQTIRLQPGQEFNGVHVVLRHMQLFRVRGKYLGPLSDANRSPLQVQVQDQRADESNGMVFGGSWNAIDPNDGTFELTNLRAGNYKLLVTSSQMGRPSSAGAVDILVVDKDLDGVLIPPHALATLTGKLRIHQPLNAERPMLNPASFQVQLTPATLASPFYTAPVAIGLDGAFTLKGISPNRYRVNLMGPTDRFYIRSISAGGSEIEDLPLDLSGGDAHIEIAVSTNVAQLIGSVEKGQDADMPGVVVIEKCCAAMSLTNLPVLANVSQAGNFAANALAPGKYRVYAFEEIDYTQARDAKFLKAFTSKAATINIAEGETKTIALKLIAFSEVEAALKEQ